MSRSPTRTIRHLLCAVFLAMLVEPQGLAFHADGSAACDDCHVSHDSQDGQPITPGLGPGEALLKAETPSDLCLSCHADRLGGVMGRVPLAPNPEKGGGNFVFLLEDNLNDGAEIPGVTPGDAAGHNVNAPAWGLSPDTRFDTSPGGSFPANEMHCTSCHDPHGNSNFRHLYSAGQGPAGQTVFTRPAPEAAGIALNGSESNGRHTAYRGGMSDWCGNCHGRYHQGASGSGFRHQTDLALGGNTSSRYNLYNGDADPTGGNAATAYLAAVPFEDPGLTTTSSQGPTSSSRLLCLSCHRAHASSAPAAGRWDFNIQRLSEDGLLSGSHPLPNPYPDTNQGSLCMKCHEGIPGPSALTGAFPGITR